MKKVMKKSMFNGNNAFFTTIIIFCVYTILFVVMVVLEFTNNNVIMVFAQIQDKIQNSTTIALENNIQL
jgi:hypothetical protein